jgi:hypothetical protein
MLPIVLGENRYMTETEFFYEEQTKEMFDPAEKYKNEWPNDCQQCPVYKDCRIMRKEHLGESPCDIWDSPDKYKEALKEAERSKEN